MDKFNKLYPSILLSLYSVKAIISQTNTISDALIILFLTSLVAISSFLEKKVQKDEIIVILEQKNQENIKKFEYINSQLQELQEIKKNLGNLVTANQINKTLARF